MRKSIQGWQEMKILKTCFTWQGNRDEVHWISVSEYYIQHKPDNTMHIQHEPDNTMLVVHARVRTFQAKRQEIWTTAATTESRAAELFTPISQQGDESPLQYWLLSLSIAACNYANFPILKISTNEECKIKYASTSLVQKKMGKIFNHTLSEYCVNFYPGLPD